MSSKEILDRFATIVIPKSEIAYYYKDCKKHYYPKASYQKYPQFYQYKVYSPDLVLWVRPNNCIAIEFEGTPEENNKWIEDTEKKCIELGFDYCIGEHENGKSPYVWLFNFEGVETHRERKAIGMLLVPKDSKIDWSNFADNHLVPVIEHSHWKHGTIHKIIRGKNPLEHKNKIPDNLTVKVERPNTKIPPVCDVLGDDFIKKILATDTKVQALLSGNISGYPSSSEARMSLIFCLVGYGLNDIQIKYVMGMSSGLNWEKKTYRNDFEINKARLYCRNKRRIIE